jgi:hypothetical protein
MVRLKRQYTDFVSIITSKNLQMFFGDIRSDFYHLLAIDETIIYECLIPKDGGVDQLSFEADYLSLMTLKKTETPEWDDFVTSFPSNSEELHTYKRGSTTVQEILVTYQNSQKKQIVRIQKTRF